MATVLDGKDMEIFVIAKSSIGQPCSEAFFFPFNAFKALVSLEKGTPVYTYTYILSPQSICIFCLFSA